MMRKQNLSLDCLFLPDTQMAVLENEQRLLRGMHASASNPPDLPPHVLPPLCPAAGLKGRGKLLIKKPVSVDGWIIRPVEALEVGSVLVPGPGSISFQIPGYPAPPPITGFLLGYAPSGADTLIGSLQAGDFTVKVWYCARLTAEIDLEDGLVFGARYTVGEAVWHKEPKQDR